jgi:hypothetical protein
MCGARQKRAEGLEYMHPKPSSHSGRIVANPEVVSEGLQPNLLHRNLKAGRGPARFFCMILKQQELG